MNAYTFRTDRHIGRCYHCNGNTFADDERDSKGRLLSRRVVWSCLQCGRPQPPFPETLPLRRNID